eukprot:3939901-Pyramimonas_sp.AAC.1
MAIVRPIRSAAVLPTTHFTPGSIAMCFCACLKSVRSRIGPIPADGKHCPGPSLRNKVRPHGDAFYVAEECVGSPIGEPSRLDRRPLSASSRAEVCGPCPAQRRIDTCVGLRAKKLAVSPKSIVVCFNVSDVKCYCQALKRRGIILQPQGQA